MKETIKKSLVGGLVFSITTLTVFIVYAIGSYSLPNKVTSGSGLLSNEWNKMVDSMDNLNSRSVPSGAIMAFNLATCPTNWTEYTPARGRFLRGIDPTGINDTVRVAGDLQNDLIQDHQHRPFNETGIQQNYQFSSGDGGLYTSAFGPETFEENVSNTSNPVTGNHGTETRPKNVAVLYCVKD